MKKSGPLPSNLPAFRWDLEARPEAYRTQPRCVGVCIILLINVVRGAFCVILYMAPRTQVLPGIRYGSLLLGARGVCPAGCISALSDGLASHFTPPNICLL